MPRFALPRSPCRWPTFAHMLRKTLYLMVKRTLSDPYFMAALRIMPNHVVPGRFGKKLASRLRLIKRLLRLWLWVISEIDTISAKPEIRPIIRSGKPPKGRGRFAVKPQQSGDKPARSTCVGKSINAVDFPLAAQLYAQGFRPQIRLWQVCSRKTLPICAGENAQPIPIIKVRILPEFHREVFDDDTPIISPFSAHTAPHLDSGETRPNTPLPQQKEKICRGRKAGQAYLDLQQITALLDHPAAALKRLARRRAKADKHRRAMAKPVKPLTAPMPPSDIWVKRVDLSDVIAMRGYHTQTIENLGFDPP